MGEELQMTDQGEEERVLEWEAGLPNVDDLTPLSQPLISSELASAFSISPEIYKTMVDVNRASQSTLSTLRRQIQEFPANQLKNLPSFNEEDQTPEQEIVEEEEEVEEVEEEEEEEEEDGTDERETRKIQRTTEEGYSNDAGTAAAASKKQRLVWTPQLHKRFVDVVGHLGIKNAVPKTIMQLMNVEGLTRENVASHLQKYRLYLKRMQGLSNEGPSSSDPLFATTPVPQSLNESGGHGHHVPLHPMPYGAPMMSMPYHGMVAPHGGYHGGHMGMVVGNPGGYHHGYEFREQQRDWSGNKFNSIASYPNVNRSN